MAWNEPDGFDLLGLPWGSTEGTITSLILVSVSLDLSSIRPDYRACVGAVVVGPAEARASFQLKGDALVSVDLRFPYRHFPAVRQLFVSRYGRPTLEQPTRLFWKGRKTSILLGRDVPASEEAWGLFIEATMEQELLCLADDAASGA